jgi:hypothetical protein
MAQGQHPHAFKLVKNKYMNIGRTTIIICLFALSVCALAAEAQQGETLPAQFEKGDISELKDKQPVYINATSQHQSEKRAAARLRPAERRR